jgi:CspA family cold shock protein
MLKAIRNFVRQRSRHHQTRSQVIEDQDTRDMRSGSEVSLQLAEPQLEEPSAQPVLGKIKWYSAEKRYGFIELLDGSGDVFLHASSLRGINISALQPGATLEFRVASGQRGPQVTEILSLDASTATPPRPPRKNFRPRPEQQLAQASVETMGTVKWYNPAKGFGFIIMDSGGGEIFVHASALERAGITGLNEGQRVFVSVAEGRKGPEAASIQVAH